MSNAIAISGTHYIVTGTVKKKQNNEAIEDLHVLVYDFDKHGKDDFLGIAVTDSTGTFSLSFNSFQFSLFFVDRQPDLYFIINDYGVEILNTRDSYIKNADESTPPINLLVDKVNDQLRDLINKEPVPGWIGGFEATNDDFAYPIPNLTSLEIEGNMDNILLLDRQQKVLWPEFSWETEQGAADPKRCYQMFAPDISRLGYTNDGKVYSIICPQQGASSPHLGSMNVEVTVTGNRGWANESTKEIAADMGVVGKIWFSPSAFKHVLVKQFSDHFHKLGLPFPSDKDHAIVVSTYKPGDDPTLINFPLTRGQSPDTDFPIPDFAKHKGIAWSVGHLGVKIGPIVKTNVEIVDKFNQLILDVFNKASGNMLKDGNILSWNVWFTAPEEVNRAEWKLHALKWRKSIDVDHQSPDGNGTKPRFFDGTEFNPMKEIFLDELPKLYILLKDELS